MKTFRDAIDDLRAIILALHPSGPDGFEGLVASALSRFTGLVFRLAKSGSQYGRDALTDAGDFGIAVEAKRYEPPLRLEQLAGKVVVGGEMLRDRIDIWTLCATSEVGDDTAIRLSAILERQGITLVLLDWGQQGIPNLAVLLAAVSEHVVNWFSRSAPGQSSVVLANALSMIAADFQFEQQSSHLKAQLSAASVGVDSLRARAEEWLRKRLRERGVSRSTFGQHVTVDDPLAPAVMRQTEIRSLQTAIDASLLDGSFVMITGEEGTGKTWLAAKWWRQCSVKPITLFVSGRRVKNLPPDDPLGGLAQLLADQFGGTAPDAVAFWRKRLERWSAPNAHGQLRFVLILDGLNEHSSKPWAEILEAYAPVLHKLGGVLIATSRPAYFWLHIKSRMTGTQEGRFLELGCYSEDELTAVLLAAGFEAEIIPGHVRDVIRNPRMCALALDLFARGLSPAFGVTRERLLLENWRARVEERGNLIAHSASDFSILLRSHARKWLAQPKLGFVLDDWGEHSGLARRRGIEAIADDITEIEEGRFLALDASDDCRYDLRAEVLPFAVALLLNNDIMRWMRETPHVGADELDEKLNALLDPVRGFDEAGDFISAAVGVGCMVENTPPMIIDALIRAWLGLQNLTETSCETIRSYAACFPHAFIRVVESSPRRMANVTRAESLEAILIDTRSAPAMKSALKPLMTRWLSMWSRIERPSWALNPEQDQARQARRRSLIEDTLAQITPDELTSLKQYTWEVADLPEIDLAGLAVRLLAGQPLAGQATGILGWAIARSIAIDAFSRSDELTWILRLNRQDPVETREAVRALVESTCGASQTPMRLAGAIALRALSDVDSSLMADSLSPLPSVKEWKRVALFCDTNPHDPSALQCRNIDRAITRLGEIDPANVWRTMGSTMEDGDLDVITPAMARWAPEQIVAFLRRLINTAPDREGIPLRQFAFNVREVSPLLTDKLITLMRQAMRNFVADTNDIDRSERYFRLANLAAAIMPHLSANDQLELICDLPPGTPLFLILQQGLSCLPANVLESMIRAAKDQPEQLRRTLFFANAVKPELTDYCRQSILDCLQSTDADLAIVAASVILVAEDAVLDARFLSAGQTGGWLADPETHSWALGRALRAVIRRAGSVDDLRFLPRKYIHSTIARFGDPARTLFADIIDDALNILLRPSKVRSSADVYLTSDQSMDGTINTLSAVPAHERTTHEGPKAVFPLTEQELAREELRRSAQFDKARDFERELNQDGLSGAMQVPDTRAVELTMRAEPSRAKKWIGRLLAENDEHAQTRVCNLALVLGSAYTHIDDREGVAVLRKFSDISPLVNITVNDVPLYADALFCAASSVEVTELRDQTFATCFNDEDLETFTMAAEQREESAWIRGYIDRMMSSATPADQARAVTLAGLCGDPQEAPLWPLLSEYGPLDTFLQAVHATANKYHSRNAWAFHWMSLAASTSDPVDYRRFAKLGEGVVDRRYAQWPAFVAKSTCWNRFSGETSERYKQAADRRSKNRKQKLFGITAPNADLLAAYSPLTRGTNR